MCIRMCTYVYTCTCAFYLYSLFSVRFREATFVYVCTYVRISPWQRSGVIGEWNGAEMICGRWLDHGLSMMTSLPFSSSSSLCPLGCFSRGMFRRKGCGSPLFRGLALTIRTDPDSPRYFYARMFKQPTLSRRVAFSPLPFRTTDRRRSGGEEADSLEITGSRRSA